MEVDPIKNPDIPTGAPILSAWQPVTLRGPLMYPAQGKVSFTAAIVEVIDRLWHLRKIVILA
jgi:hypothetical protein